MLNGLDPIIIFQFKKQIDPTFIGPQPEPIIARIPLISEIPTFIEAPPIPIYLSEKITGLYIESETKSIDITTDIESKTDAKSTDVTQKPIGSSVKVELIAVQDSIGVTLLSALADLILDKLTSKEYAITYLHGAITIFRGLINSFSIEQVTGTDKYRINIEFSRGPTKLPTPEPASVTVNKTNTGIIPINL